MRGGGGLRFRHIHWLHPSLWAGARSLCHQSARALCCENNDSTNQLQGSKKLAQCQRRCSSRAGRRTSSTSFCARLVGLFVGRLVGWQALFQRFRALVLRRVVLRCVALLCFALRCVALRCVVLRCVAFSFVFVCGAALRLSQSAVTIQNLSVALRDPVSSGRVHCRLIDEAVFKSTNQPTNQPNN